MCQFLCHVQLFAIPWTVACQAPLSMEFSKQEYWSRLPFSSPLNLKKKKKPGLRAMSKMGQEEPLVMKVRDLLSPKKSQQEISQGFC